MRERPIIVGELAVRRAPMGIRRTTGPRAFAGFVARASSACMAAALHAVAVIALLNANPHERVERERTVAGVAIPADAYSIEPFTLVELDETVRTDTTWPEPPALAALSLPGELRLTLPPVELYRSDLGEVEALEETARSTEPVAIEGEDRLELFAKYIAQIKARVSRAWERPDGRSDTRCLVYVTQDATGRVLDIDMHTCTANDEWRSSLITAIRRASPFPAPPVAQVFAERVSIDFGE